MAWVRAAICLMAVGTMTLALAADDDDPAAPAPAGPIGAEFQKDEVDRAVERAVLYLVDQQEDDGAITERNQNNTAMTSLAIMAVSAVGNQPTDPTPQGRAIRKALDYVLRESNQESDGYFGRRDGSRMYGHGITTLMLAEMIGMGVDEEHDRIILQRLQKAVTLILDSQKVRKDRRYQGGWRYSPDSRDADLSVTVWQVMALRSAYNAGLEVPKSAIDEAAEYIRYSYHSRFEGGKPVDLRSGFGYQPGHGPTYSTVAAGMLALQVCGYYDDPTVIGAGDWLRDYTPHWHDNWFFYGTYYYAQGMYQRGGDHAAHARQAVANLLLPNQRNDGSWEAANGSERSAGRVYATALGVLSLSVKYHYLPIYQR